MPQGPYGVVLSLLQANPDLEVSGRIHRNNSRYVHENSTTVDLDLGGSMGKPGDLAYPSEPSVFVENAVNNLADRLKSDVAAWNRMIARELDKELEYQQSDKALIEWMNGCVDWRFDADGERVSMDDYLPVSNLEPGIQDKVLRAYVDLFNRMPDQVYADLVRRDLRFDPQGNRVDMTQFLRVDQLSEEVKNCVLDKYRNFLVRDDASWAESIGDFWKQYLHGLGFSRVQISYSLGGSQGDGASFTADSIDVLELCKGMMHKPKVEAAAIRMANSLLA